MHAKHESKSPRGVKKSVKSLSEVSGLEKMGMVSAKSSSKFPPSGESPGA